LVLMMIDHRWIWLLLLLLLLMLMLIVHDSLSS